MNANINVDINDALGTKEIIKEDYFKVGDLVKAISETKELIEEPTEDSNETKITEKFVETEEFFVIVGIQEDSLIVWVVNPTVPEGMTQTSISIDTLKNFKSLTILNR